MISMLLQHHRHEQSIENFNMVVTYDNGTLVGSDDLLPIGTSLVANVSLMDHSSKDVTDRRSVLVHLHPECACLTQLSTLLALQQRSAYQSFSRVILYNHVSVLLYLRYLCQYDSV